MEKIAEGIEFEKSQGIDSFCLEDCVKVPLRHREKKQVKDVRTYKDSSLLSC